MSDNKKALEQSLKRLNRAANGPVCVKRVFIKDLPDESCRGFLVVGIIIAKRESRMVTRSNYKEQEELNAQRSISFVTNFTLRDSTGSTINVTFWHNSTKEAENMDNRFHIGDVVELSNFRVRKRNFQSVEEIKYSPCVSSPVTIIMSEAARSQIAKHPDEEFCASMLKLLSLPTKIYSDEVNVKPKSFNHSAQEELQVLHHSPPKTLKNISVQDIGNHIDVIATVVFVKKIKKIQTSKNNAAKQLDSNNTELMRPSKELQMREVILGEISSETETNQHEMELKLWDYDLIHIADKWSAGKDTLLLNDVRVDRKKNTSGAVYATSNINQMDLFLSASSRTIIIFNPILPVKLKHQLQSNRIDENNNELLHIQDGLHSMETTYNQGICTQFEIKRKHYEIMESPAPAEKYSNDTLHQNTNKIVNVAAVKQMLDKHHPKNVNRNSLPALGPFGDKFHSSGDLIMESMITIYGYLANLDPTEEDAISKRVVGPFVKLNSQEKNETVNNFNLKADVVDATGDISCQLSHEVAEKIICPIDKFEQMSADEKRSFRWLYLMTPVKIDLQVRSTMKMPIITDCNKVTLAEMKDKATSTHHNYKCDVPKRYGLAHMSSPEKDSDRNLAKKFKNDFKKNLA